MRSRFTAAAVLLGVIAAGCGGAGPDEVVRDYLTAVVKGDGAAACEQFTPRLRREIDRSPAARRSGATYVEIMELAAALNPDLTERDIEDLSIEVEDEGGRATARLRNPLAGQRESIDLLEVDGGWRIADLETRPND